MHFLSRKATVSLDDRIEERLRSVIDPETRENVVEMGLVRELVATEVGKVRLSSSGRPRTIAISPSCRLLEPIRQLPSRGSTGSLRTGGSFALSCVEGRAPAFPQVTG